MDLVFDRGSQLEFYPVKRRRLQESPELSKREFHIIWGEFCELTEAIRIVTLLFLPEDYLWMFWQHFPNKHIYRNAYFSRYHIKSFCHVFKSGKVGVFKNLVSLDLAVEPSWQQFLFDNFNTFFPVLRRLTFLWPWVTPGTSGLLVLLNHPTIKIFRVKTYCGQYLTEVFPIVSSFLREKVKDIRVKCTELKLVELSQSGHKIAFCLSSGLVSIRPRKSDWKISIFHLGIFNGRLGTLNISLLPRIRQCTELVLASEEFSNMDELLTIGEKFPSLRRLKIYTSSDTVEGFVHEGARTACCEYRIASLKELRGTIYDTDV